MSLTIHPKDIVEASESPLLASAEHWERRPLGEVATILNGYAFASKLFSRTEGIPLIRIRDISNGTTTERFKGPFDERYLIRSGDLLVGMDGEFNVARWSGPPALLNQRVMKIEPKAETLDIDFLTHLLPGYLQAIHDLTSSTTVKHLSSRDVERLPIPVPELEEQQKIATQIAALLELVGSSSDRLATIPALLKKFRQSVLAAACSGQLTADWRESQSRLTDIDSFIRDLERVRLLSRAKTPKNAQNEPTPVFDVPDSWRWVSLRTLVELKGGVTKGEKRRAGQELISVPYLRVANVQRGFLDLSDIKHIEATPKELEELRLQPNDILFNEGGDRDKLGRGWVWEGQIDNCIHQNHVFRGRLFDDRIPAKLVSLYGNSIGAQHFIDEGKQTVNLASLSITKLGDMAFPLAPPEEMAEIMRQVESLFALAASIESRLAEATVQVERTTQAILAKAFRGELEVDVTELPEPKRPTTSIDTPLAHEEPPEQILIPSKMKTSLKEIVQTSDQSRFDPEQLRTLFSGDYEAFRDELFALLSEPRPILRQQFDESTQRILLVKE